MEDEDLHIQFHNTIKYRREVEVYQWVEKKEHSSDDDTKYYYEKEWSNKLHNSSNFRKFHESEHNPSEWPVNSKVVVNSDVAVGAFKLNERQKGEKMNDYEKAKDIEELASTVSNEAGSLFTDAGWAMPYYQGGYVYANRQ